MTAAHGPPGRDVDDMLPHLREMGGVRVTDDILDDVRGYDLMGTAGTFF